MARMPGNLLRKRDLPAVTVSGDGMSFLRCGALSANAAPPRTGAAKAGALWRGFALCASEGARQATRAARAGAGRILRRIIGIDPGLGCTGWGVIEQRGSRLAHVANGRLRGGAGPLAERLLRLYRGLRAVIAEHAPSEAAVEITFVGRDSAGALKLGQARGIALLAPAEAGLPVAEYAPNLIKKTVVGAGHADKAQIAHMVRVQLGAIEIAGPDAADALAIAICHAHHGGPVGRLAALAEAGR